MDLVCVIRESERERENLVSDDDWSFLLSMKVEKQFWFFFFLERKSNMRTLEEEGGLRKLFIVLDG